MVEFKGFDQSRWLDLCIFLLFFTSELQQVFHLLLLLNMPWKVKDFEPAFNYVHSKLLCVYTSAYKNKFMSSNIGLMSIVFANGPGDWGSIPGRVIPKTQKMLLDSALLNTQHYKVRIKGKVELIRRVAPPSTHRCSSYWKGNLRVTLTTLLFTIQGAYVCVCVYTDYSEISKPRLERNVIAGHFYCGNKLQLLLKL